MVWNNVCLKDDKSQTLREWWARGCLPWVQVVSRSGLQCTMSPGLVEKRNFQWGVRDLVEASLSPWLHSALAVTPGSSTLRPCQHHRENASTMSTAASTREDEMVEAALKILPFHIQPHNFPKTFTCGIPFAFPSTAVKKAGNSRC